MIQRLLLITLASLAIVPGDAFGQLRHAKLVARVDSIARQAIAEGPTPGLSIAVARGKETLVAKGYGFARLEDSTLAGAETVYPIASITKQFTAAAIMQLVEANRLKVKDELSKQLPDYSTRDQRVTIQQLLNHTSGISDNGGQDRWGRRRSALDFTPQAFVPAFTGQPLDFAPGEKFAYSNAGYYLLGLIVEKVSGQRFAEYAGEHLLAPAGMTGSSYCGLDSPIRARGYDTPDGVVVPATPVGDDQLFAAAGLCSNVVDLVKWQRALYDGKVVNHLSWTLMIQPAELKDGSRASYGYGLTLGQLGKHRWVGHGGSVRGFASQLTFYPDDDLTVVVLANSERAHPRRIADRIAGVVLGVIEPKIKDLPLSAEDLARYVGTYDLAGDRVEIYGLGGKLMMRIAEADGWRLLYQGSHEFVSEPDPATNIFFRLSQGRAKSLVFTVRELTLSAPRR